MQRVTGFLFGSLAPALEVLLVLVGLGLLGWQGVVYTWTGVWPRIEIAALHLTAPASEGLTGWLLSLPLPGTCIAVGIAMFFLMPPAYAHT